MYVSFFWDFVKNWKSFFLKKNLFKNPSQHRFCAPSIVNLAQPLAAITYNYQAAAEPEPEPEAEEKFWLTSKTFLKNALQRNWQMDRAHHLYKMNLYFPKSACEAKISKNINRIGKQAQQE